MPKADDLFRPTVVPDAQQSPPAVSESNDSSPRATGRVKHAEKITVYVSSDELYELEAARLRLRRELNTPVDRGRLVREAIGIVLDDLAVKGEKSMLLERLNEA